MIKTKDLKKNEKTSEVKILLYTNDIWKNRIVLLTFLIETCACCKENFSAGEEIFHSTFFTRQRFLKNEIP